MNIPHIVRFALILLLASSLAYGRGSRGSSDSGSYRSYSSSRSASSRSAGFTSSRASSSGSYSPRMPSAGRSTWGHSDHSAPASRSSAYQRQAPSIPRSSAYQRQAPSIPRSSAYQRQAPSDSRSSTYQRQAPSVPRSSTYQRQAPSDSRSAAHQRQAPSVPGSSTYQRQAPSVSRSAAQPSPTYRQSSAGRQSPAYQRTSPYQSRSTSVRSLPTSGTSAYQRTTTSRTSSDQRGAASPPGSARRGATAPSGAEAPGSAPSRTASRQPYSSGRTGDLGRFVTRSRSNSLQGFRPPGDRSTYARGGGSSRTAGFPDADSRYAGAGAATRGGGGGPNAGAARQGGAARPGGQYAGAPRNYYRGYDHGNGDGYYASGGYNDCYPRRYHGCSSGWYVGFNWGWYFGYGSGGFGVGVGWGYPGGGWCQPGYGSGWWGFWYPQPVCVAYVPYGFYFDRQPVFVREVTVVEQVPVYVDESGNPIEPQASDPAPAEEWEPDGAEARPTPPPAPESADGENVLHEAEGPPVLTATTEKYLREGSEEFAKADYEAAAMAFRMAVASDPHAAPPRFAFGQALLALGDYANAAKILRGALETEPAILNAPGSIVGVYRHAEEFNEVMNTLKTASLKSSGNADLLFLVGYQQYFSGDPQAVVTFGRLAEQHPEDPMVRLFGPALKDRFPELANLPLPGEKK